MKYIIPDYDGDELEVYDEAEYVIVKLHSEQIEEPVYVRLETGAVQDLVFAVNRAKGEAERYEARRG